jgi:transcription elongation factor Elf1
MAAKRPTKKKPAVSGKKKRRKKMRLSLKSRSIKEKDSYTASVGWSTSAKTLDDPALAIPTEPDKLKHQCTLCGSIMMVAKPKRAKYTITCPHCEHIDEFS